LPPRYCARSSRICLLRLSRTNWSLQRRRVAPPMRPFNTDHERS
jgi:hypothetical protein